MTLGGVGVVEPIGKKMSQLDCYAFHEPGRLVSLPAAAFPPWFVALLIFPLVQVQVNFSLEIHRYKAQIRGRSFFYTEAPQPERRQRQVVAADHAAFFVDARHEAKLEGLASDA